MCLYVQYESSSSMFKQAALLIYHNTLEQNVHVGVLLRCIC